MRLVSLFFIVVIVLMIMWFMVENATQVVDELWIFQYTYLEVPLVSVLFGSFVFGVVMGFLIPVFQYIGAKGEVRKLKKEAKKLRSELNELRNVGIETELEEEDSPSVAKEEEKPLDDDSAESDEEDENNDR